MTARADADSGRIPPRQSSRVGATAAPSDAGASSLSAPPRPAVRPPALLRMLAVLKPAFRARPPSADALTDRHLADVGLLRSDLPDHRGWRR